MIKKNNLSHMMRIGLGVFLIIALAWLAFLLLIGRPLVFSTINQKDTVSLYKITLIKNTDIEGSLSSSLYFEIACENVTCNSAQKPILITDSAFVTERGIEFPKLAVTRIKGHTYYIFQNRGGTEGHNSLSYEVFTISNMGEISRVQTQGIYNTCTTVKPIHKFDRIVFPKSGKCSDILVNWEDYFLSTRQVIRVE